MTNADVARVFRQIAVMLELEGANVFRIRAYQDAARIVESMGEPVGAAAAREGGLEGIRGIGRDLAGKIRELIATGHTPVYDELRSKYPETLIGLTELQGLGARRVKLLFQTLGIRDRPGLEQAARDGKLRGLPGFGEKMEQKILKSLASMEQWAGRVLLAQAWVIAEPIVSGLRGIDGVTQVEAAGSFRRRRDTIGDLDIVVCGGDCERVMDHFIQWGGVGAELLGRGGTKCSLRISIGLQVDLRHVPEESFGAALLYFTGSKDHNIALRRIALDKGLSLNEYGLLRDGRPVAGRTEQDIYRALDLPWIPPELREGHNEIALAREGRLPKLVGLDDLRGDLHMHTTRTDGRSSLSEMVAACCARGYAYCAITDHSQSLTFAGGFDAARVRQSVEEVAAVRREVPGIEVLHGLEVDILPDGSLDLSDDGLDLLDWVTISLHRNFDQPAAEMTDRVLRALQHPRVCAMSHPTARKIGQRPGVAMDLDRIFARAAELGVAMEINAQPDRVDLSDTHARRAAELGVSFVIDTDAHSVAELDQMRWGVFAARRAGLTPAHVLNTMALPKLRPRLRTHGRPAGTAPAIATGRKSAGRGATAPRRKKPASSAAQPKSGRAVRSKPRKGAR